MSTAEGDRHSIAGTAATSLLMPAQHVAATSYLNRAPVTRDVRGIDSRALQAAMGSAMTDARVVHLKGDIAHDLSRASSAASALRDASGKGPLSYGAFVPKENLSNLERMHGDLGGFEKAYAKLHNDPRYQGRIPTPDKLRGVVLGSENMPAHVLAHELGHAAGPRAYLKPATQLSLKLAPLAALLGMVGTRNESTHRNIALGATAAMLPGLAAEVDASWRGRKILKQMVGDTGWRKLPRLSRLSPGMGLPTYALMAGIPGAAYGLQKLMGNYQGELTLRQRLGNMLRGDSMKSASVRNDVVIHMLKRRAGGDINDSGGLVTALFGETKQASALDKALLLLSAGYGGVSGHDMASSEVKPGEEKTLWGKVAPVLGTGAGFIGGGIGNFLGAEAPTPRFLRGRLRPLGAVARMIGGGLLGTELAKLPSRMSLGERLFGPQTVDLPHQGLAAALFGETKQASTTGTDNQTLAIGGGALGGQLSGLVGGNLLEAIGDTITEADS